MAEPAVTADLSLPLNAVTAVLASSFEHKSSRSDIAARMGQTGEVRTLEEFALGCHCVRSNIAEFFPVIEPTASDYVVDCCKCPFRMIQMTVQHAFGL